LTDTNPPARTRARLRRAATIAAGGGIVVSTLVIAPAAIADPVDHLRADTWTVDGQRATTTLPGDLAGLGDVVAVNQDPAQAVSVAGAGSLAATVGSLQLRPTAAAVGAAANCLSGAPDRTPVTCATYGSDITFPAPVVDPVLRLSASGGANSSTAGRCTFDWYDVAVSGIDGAPTDAARLSLLTSPNGWTLEGDTITRPAQSAASACDPPIGGAMYLQVHGVVQSLHLDNAFRAMVNYGGPTNALSTFQGVAVQVLLPTTDLVAEASAPALLPAAGTAEWTFSVRNDGANVSHGYVLTAELPAGVTDIVAPDGCTVAGTTVTCTVAPAGSTLAPSGTVPTFAALTTPNGTADAVLAAGASAQPIVVRATTPSDRDADLTATALVSGADLDTAPASNSTTVTSAAQRPSLAMTKHADRASVTGAGQTLVYSFDVENTGDAALSGLTIDEGRFSGTGLLGPVRCAATDLRPAETTSCSVRYTATTEDAATPAITNEATASALPAGEPQRVSSAASSVSVPVTVATVPGDVTGEADGGQSSGSGRPGDSSATPGVVVGSTDAAQPGADRSPDAADGRDTGSDVGALAYTGAELLPLAVGSALVLVAGLGIWTAARRRRA
jgi:hypothetical protein